MNWLDYSQLLLDKCKKKEIPYHVGFELTPLCNFRCNMCYIRLSPEQAAAQGRMLTTEQWIYLARETKKLGALSLEVTGGEVLTRPDFTILYKEFIDLGFLIVLRTNGYLFNEESISLLMKNKPSKVYITLYGASNATYQKVCGVSDGFTTVTNNILKLKDAGLDVRITATITSENADDMELMKEWANIHGFSITFAGMLFTPVRGAKRSIEHLKYKVPDEEYELTEEMTKIPHNVINRQLYMDPFWMCRAFRARYTITWDGHMTLCSSNPYIWKDPFKNGLGPAFHDLYNDLKSVRRPKECETCKYIDLCTVCPSMLHSATGSMEKTNEEMCRVARRKFKNMVLKGGSILNPNSNMFDNECEE